MSWTGLLILYSEKAGRSAQKQEQMSAKAATDDSESDAMADFYDESEEDGEDSMADSQSQAAAGALRSKDIDLGGSGPRYELKLMALVCLPYTETK